MNCPSFETLSAFVDHELEPAEARAIEAHLATCDRCREELLDWVDDERRLVALDCVEPEILVAFSDGVLGDAEQIAVNAHLATCPHCRGELDAMNAIVEPALIAAAATAPVGMSWGERAAAVLTGFGRMMIRPGPLLSAVTATALLIIALAQTAPREALHRLDTTVSVTPAEERKAEVQLQQPAAPAPPALRKDAWREEDAPASLSASGARAPNVKAGKEEPAPAPAAPPAASLAVPEGAAEKSKIRSMDSANRSIDDAEEEPRALFDKGHAEPAATRAAGVAAGLTEPEGLTSQRPRSMAPTETLLTGRAEPNDDSEVVARFATTDVRLWLADRDGWIRYELNDGRRVWMRASELDAIMPTPAGPPIGVHMHR